MCRPNRYLDNLILTRLNYELATALRSAHKRNVRHAVTLYRLKVIHSLDGDTTELFDYETDELIARGTPEEVEQVLARLIREAAQEGSDLGYLRPHSRDPGAPG